MNATPDAVVIGAGHNGLVAANLLVDAGWDVVVCEAAPTPGGAVATAEVTAEGFRNDLFSAFYPLAAASPVIQGLSLDAYGVAWSRAPAVLTHLLPDGRSATFWQDAARTAAGLGGADGESWLRLTDQWDRIGDEVIAALLAPWPPIRPAATLLRHLGTSEALRLARMAAQPVRRFGEENFSGPGGPILFAGNALHADLPPDGAGSAIYGWLLTMLGHSHGFPVPVGGAGVLIPGLVRRLEAKGGELRCNAPVVSVQVRGGRAVGVDLAPGERIVARRAVLADVAAPALFEHLVGARHLPDRFMADLNNFEWDTRTLKIDWALNRPVPWTDVDARQAGTVHLGVDMDGLTDYAADLATRRTPSRPFVLFGQMTTADATRSPAGTESAWAYTHLPRRVSLSAAAIAEQVERVETLLEGMHPASDRRSSLVMCKRPTTWNTTTPISSRAPSTAARAASPTACVPARPGSGRAVHSDRLPLPRRRVDPPRWRRARRLRLERRPCRTDPTLHHRRAAAWRAEPVDATHLSLSEGDTVATNEIEIAASCHPVYAVFSDGWTYTNWVVGTSHMQAVEASWPGVGSRLFHCSGAWPVAMRDETIVEEATPEERLVLTARGRPFGEARITIDLVAAGAAGARCIVTMNEEPTRGPGRWLHSPASEALLVRRNTESLNRLAALCERRTSPAG